MGYLNKSPCFWVAFGCGFVVDKRIMQMTPHSETTGDRNQGAQKRLSAEEINECPIIRYKGPVCLVRTQDELLTAVASLEHETLLGFDTETKTAFKKGEHYAPALLQLATANQVFIFQLRPLRNFKSLVKILEDPKIVKAGVAVDYDVKQLRQITPFRPAGFVDLGGLAKKAGLQNHGLRGMAAALLGFRISKNTQRSNWAQDRLAPMQVIYAATDAWVSRLLYEKFRE